MPRKTRNYQPLLLMLVIIAAAAYLWFVLKAPIVTTSETLRAYTTRAKYVRLALSVGYVVGWLAAAYAVAYLLKYYRLIKREPEGRGFGQIWLGLLIFMLGSLIWPPITAARALVISNPSFVQTLSMLLNYLIIVPALVAFYLIYRGTSQILLAIKIGPRLRTRHLWWFGGLVLFTPLYLWFIFSNPIRGIPPAPGVPSTYYLSDLWIVLTIVIPAFATWTFSILAIINLNIFKNRAPGVIYKRALPAFNWGLVATVLGLMLLQCVASAGSNKILALGLWASIAAVYTSNAALATGFLLMAKSTKQLTRIEEI